MEMWLRDEPEPGIRSSGGRGEGLEMWQRDKPEPGIRGIGGRGEGISKVLHAHSQSCGRDRKEIVVHVVASPENGCLAGRAPARKTCRRLQSKKLQERGTVSHPVAIMCGTRDCVGLDSIYGLPLRVRAGRRGGA